MEPYTTLHFIADAIFYSSWFFLAVSGVFSFLNDYLTTKIERLSQNLSENICDHSFKIYLFLLFASFLLRWYANSLYW